MSLRTSPMLHRLQHKASLFILIRFIWGKRNMVCRWQIPAGRRGFAQIGTQCGHNEIRQFSDWKSIFHFPLTRQRRATSNDRNEWVFTIASRNSSGHCPSRQRYARATSVFARDKQLYLLTKSYVRALCHTSIHVHACFRCWLNKIQPHQSRSLFVTTERPICNAYAIRIDRKTASTSYRLQITWNRFINILQYELSVVSSSQRFFSREKEATARVVLQRPIIVRQTCSVPWENENLKICSILTLRHIP